MTRRRVLLAVLLAFAGAARSARADAIYLRSAVGQPWGVNTNEQAMDAAFGAGNWQDQRFETTDVSSLFSTTDRFIFMEGGDNTADEMEAFLGSNRAALEAWVSSGGSLYMNAAPNEGDGMDYGFGGVTLSFNNFYTTATFSVTAADPTHPIFNGPFTPVGTAYTGGYFGHALTGGAGLTALIVDAADHSRVVLAEASYGAGHVLFGGLTTDNFHDPQPQAQNLTANILTYGNGQVGTPTAVPLPAVVWGGLTLMGGAGGFRALRRRGPAAQPA